MRIWILILILSTSSFVSAGNVSIDDFRSWAQKKSDIAGKLDFYDSERIVSICLTDKDIAYLVPVSLSDMGRNSMFQTALAIPSREEVVLLMGSMVKQVEKVVDVDHNGISEIIVKNSDSGGGEEIGEKAIVQIDKNGKVTVLRKVSIYTNRGVWGKQTATYHMQDVTWDFADSNMGDDIKDLIETITVEKGRNGKEPLINKTVKHYHFINNYFFKYKEENNL